MVDKISCAGLRPARRGLPNPLRAILSCHNFADNVLLQRYASFDGLATEWRLTVGQPFKAGILVPRVKTLGYHQPSLRD